MKKTIKSILILFAFCAFIVSVKAETFNCSLNGYTIEYNTDGTIVSAKNASGSEAAKRYESSFSPKNSSECPTEKNAKAILIDSGRTLKVYTLSEYQNYKVQTEKLADMGGCSGYTTKDSCEGNTHYSCDWRGTEDEGSCNMSVEEEINTNMGGCSRYTDQRSCENNRYYSCIWNDNEFGASYCNTDKLKYVRCGDTFDIPYQVPQIMSFAVNLLKIAAPIILIIISIITLLKAISASNEDEIKKAQKGLVKKVVAAVMVFFVISIVQFVVLKVADTDSSKGDSEADNLSNCLTCFLNNKCEETAYYKTNSFGEYECRYLKNKKQFICPENEKN